MPLFKNFFRNIYINTKDRFFMLKKNVYFALSLVMFLLGLFLTETDLTGRVIGGIFFGKILNSILSIFFIMTSIFLFITTVDLEERARFEWKKYRINRESILEDIEQEYIKSKNKNRRPSKLQDIIERKITGGDLIHSGGQNKRSGYEEQFYEGHAAKGGRVIDVESHIEKKGSNKGKLIHFGQPANAKYIWVIDEDGNFIIANKQTLLHDMPQMNFNRIDYSHRKHNLPHATLARGKSIYGSGEVLVEGGKVKSFNTSSGHYIDLDDISSFNKQGEEVFLYYIKKVGWKEVDDKAKYKIIK